MALEGFILSAATHTQKDKCHIFSLICEFHLQIFRCAFFAWSKQEILGPWAGEEALEIRR